MCAPEFERHDASLSVVRHCHINVADACDLPRPVLYSADGREFRHSSNTLTPSPRNRGHVLHGCDNDRRTDDHDGSPQKPGQGVTTGGHNVRVWRGADRQPRRMCTVNSFTPNVNGWRDDAKHDRKISAHTGAGRCAGGDGQRSTYELRKEIAPRPDPREISVEVDPHHLPSPHSSEPHHRAGPIVFR